MKRKSIAALGFMLALAVAPKAEIVEQVLVKVNGDILSKSELEQRQVAAIRQMGAQNRASDAQLRKMLDDLTPQLLVEVVDEMLLVQRGRELGLKLSDEQFKSAVDNIKKENKIENDAQFEAALRQERMTLTELRQGLERQMMVQGVRRNEVLGKVSVTEEESRRFYDAHVGEFTTSPSVTLREILVAIPAGADGDAAAKAKVEQIRQRAVTGEPFDKLATELSDAPSKANAGLIGPLSVDELSSDLKALITSMKQGDVSTVLKTPTGYQLLKVETLTTSQTKPFAQAKADIDNRVYDLKMQEETEKYLKKLRGQAIIEWKNADLKKAYEAGLQAKATTPTAAPATTPAPAAPK
jgi:peptidyl-prolyl cis-trans isomerase SurA